MDTGQHDMGSHFADDMGIVGDVGRAWIGCPSIGFDGRALSQVGGDKTVQRGGGKVLDCCEANAAGRAVGDFDRGGDEHFALGRAPAAACDRIVLAAQGDFCLVDLGDPSQERAGRRDHGPPQLGAQQPSRLIGAQPKQPLQLQRRNSVGVGGHQIGGPEPDGQRKLRAVHDRPRRDGGLPAATGAFVGESLSPCGQALS